MTAALADIPLTTLQGQEASLGEYSGKVLLVVNTASGCGLTPQFEGLERLYRQFRDRGVVVLGFPSNDFGGQEPLDDEGIAEFCATEYGVDFPMFQKTVVVGPDKHPLYAALTTAIPHAKNSEGMRERQAARRVPNPEPEVLWNFEKFLIGRDGAPVARFSPDTAPDDPELVATIEAALAS